MLVKILIPDSLHDVRWFSKLDVLSVVQEVAIHFCEEFG